KTPLLPAADYTVFIKGAADEQGHLLEFAALQFRTPAISVTDTVSGTGLPQPSQSLPMAVVTGASSAAAIPGAVDVSQLRWTPGRQPTGDDELWIPEAKHFSGKWWSTLPKVEDAPAPQAPQGITALSGRVLRMNGRPLAGVTLSVAGKQSAT